MINLLLKCFVFSLSIIISNLSHAENSPSDINRLIILGDSLSDNGNLYSLTKKMHGFSHKIPIIPDPDIYWYGRFSDGPVWDEFLANLLHLIPEKLSGENRESAQFQNYAYGGSWAETLQPDFHPQYSVDTHWHVIPPTLTEQVTNYLLRTKLQSPSNYKNIFAKDLVFIWIGSNDYLNQAIGGSPLARDPNISTSAVISVIKENIEKLIQAGCSHFVIFGSPNLGKVPNIALRDPQALSLVPALIATSKMHNEKLTYLLDHFSQMYPYIQFTYINVDQVFTNEYQLASERAEFYSHTHNGQFQKVTTPCIIEANDPDPALIKFFPLNPILSLEIKSKFKQLMIRKYRQCDLHQPNDAQSPYNYLETYHSGGIFFDHVHPLTHLHAKIALLICQKLASEGYRFLQSDIQYQPILCDQINTNDLVQRIIDPPFPNSKFNPNYEK